MCNAAATLQFPSLGSIKYIYLSVLPELYNIVSAHIHELLATDITALSFTTDIWSSDVDIDVVVDIAYYVTFFQQSVKYFILLIYYFKF